MKLQMYAKIHKTIFGGRMTKSCQRVRQDASLANYYKRVGASGPGAYCIPCMKAQVLERQRSLKQQAITYKGARCERCGYDRCSAALEFHHRDPSQKDFALSHAKMTSFEKAKVELDKCDLLCAN